MISAAASPSEPTATFTQVCPGLYQIGPAGSSSAAYAYFVLANPGVEDNAPSPPVPPSLAQIWNEPAYGGWIVYSAVPVAQTIAPQFAQTARSNLPPLQLTYPFAFPCLVWIEDPQTWVQSGAPLAGLPWILATPSGVPQGSPASYTFDTLRQLQTPNPTPGTGSWNYGWVPNLTLSIGNQLPISLVSLPDGSPAFQIVASSRNYSLIQVMYGTVAPYQDNLLGPNAWQVNIPLTGEATGSFCFSVGLQPGPLAHYFVCGFMYAYGPQANALVYPFLSPNYPFDQNPIPHTYVAFDVRLNPVLLANPLSTRFALHLDASSWPCNRVDCQNAAALTSPYFFLTSGVAATLRPWQAPASASPGLLDNPPGFVLSVGPPTSAAATGSPGAPAYYLAPIGPFQVAVASPSGAGTVDVMAGLFAQEFLRLGDGDIVAFVPGQSAYAPGFAPAGSPAPNEAAASPNSPLLTDQYTTAWMSYPVLSSSGRVGYFSQPSASVYYSALGGETYPEAVDAMLSDFAAAAVFPIVPYGGISAWTQYSPPAPYASAQVFADFEAGVLTPSRHQRLVSPTGPRFLAPPSPAGSPPPPLAAAETPQGLVVELNPPGGGPPEGSWQRLLLAQSPPTNGSPPRTLGFESSGSAAVVAPALANALMQNQLFLVISDAASVGPFDNELDVGGFRFIFDLNQGSPLGPTSTVLIFKFNTQFSLAELAQQPNLWTGKEEFVGGPDEIGQVQQVILNAIATGIKYKDATGDPFGTFNLLVPDRELTGVIAFNVPIDGNGMPPDLQMLMGGVQGQLTAHHFGIEGNKVTWGGGTPTLASSLFGVIFYPGAPVASPASPADAPPLAYEVENLTVVISNSKIALFNVTVGLTANQLFGRDVSLEPPVSAPASPPPPNTINITGTYQTRNGVGTVVFVTKTPFRYDMVPAENAVRVLERIEFDSAALVPWSSTPGASPHTTDVVARFTLAGQIWFAASPFPGTGHFDLFSYGTGSPAKGLNFGNFVVDVAFTLDAAGAMQPGSKTVTFRPALLQPQADPLSIRRGSLLFSLPLKLTGFAHSETGLTSSKTGALPVHCLQLQPTKYLPPPASPVWPPPSPASPQVPASPDVAQSAPYVTTAPVYALQFELPLGSLGSLSDAHAGIMASLLIGWGPSPVVPGSDAAAVMVQLPQLSAGYQGFNLEGILKTVFGDANMLRVDLPEGPVYAILFSNVQLSVFGYTFPPGVLIDFMVFAGQPQGGASTNTNNIAWFVAAQQK
jgi:hypothetical protein